MKIEKNKKEYSNIRSLGFVKNIGELKEVIKNYPDETSFGFKNQPIQKLFEINYKEKTFIVFDNLSKEADHGG